MTVRRKIALILIAFMALMFAAILLLFRVVLQKNVDFLEESRVWDNIARAANVLDNETVLLDRFTHDYSAWDEAYRFVQNPQPEFIKSNLPISAFTVNDCDFVVFINAAGKMVCQKSYDLQTGREIPIPAGMLPLLVPGSPLLRLAAENSSVRGYVTLPEGIYMVVSRPVLTSEEEGPIQGALVTGRKFDQRYVDRLSSIIRLPLVLKGPDAAAPGGPSGANRSVRFLDGHMAEGAIPFLDVSGKRAFALVFRQERTIRGQFLRVQNYSLIILALFALIGFWLSLFTVDRLITSRLGRISRSLKKTETTGDLTGRIEVHSTDELAVLGRAVNDMLDALNRQVSKIRAAEADVTKSEAKYHSLFEAATDAAFLETFDGRIIDCNPAACHLLGYTREEMLRLSVADLLPAEAKSQVADWSAAIAAAGSAFFETVNVAKDGEAIPIEVSVRQARIGDGDFAVTFVHDLRKRKRDEKIRKVLLQISEAACAAHDLGELSRLIHDAVTEIIPTRNFYIALYDAEVGLFSFPFFVDEFDPPPEPRPLGRGLADYVLRRGELLLASSSDIEALMRAGELEIGGTIPVAWLGAPLKTEAAVIGVMAVQSYQAARFFEGEEKAVFLFLSSQVAMAIDRVRARERLQESLQEKEALLREVHHRVKNNMQIISSMFNLQAGEISDPRAVDKIRQGQARIRSMALIHEKLYQSKDLARINFGDYIRSLASHIFLFWKVDGERIKLEMDLEDATLDINTAIPCGLILNELLSNALKHAFPDGRTGTVRLSLHREPGGGLSLSIGDDGVGLPLGIEPGRTNTLGLQIVGLLTRQLNGTLAIDRIAGTAFSIRFRELSYKSRI
jgi:PAS domain S-box-containing protein